MEIINVYQGNIDRRAIERAAEALRQGELVIYPTDTHPALAADALNGKTVAELCRLKGVNPDKHTLTLVADSISMAAEYARIDNRAFAVMKRNTPGAVTFLLPPAQTLPKVFKGRKQVGIRIPDNAIARTLAEELGHPLLSGSLGETDSYELESNVALLLNDAEAEFDTRRESSAIVDLTDSSAPEVIRESSRQLEL